MSSVREQVIRQWELQEHLRAAEPDDQLATALYFRLCAIDGLGVDGWALFRVVRESEESLDAIGLMTLLPSGSIPIAMSVKADKAQ